jgi:hypothetical protein
LLLRCSFNGIAFLVILFARSSPIFETNKGRNLMQEAAFVDQTGLGAVLDGQTLVTLPMMGSFRFCRCLPQ